MRILADENIDYPVVQKLRANGLEVLSIMDLHQGESDNFVFSVANELNCVLLTNDKDFGDLVIRHQLQHKGVILLRLSSNDLEEIAAIVLRLLHLYGNQIVNRFTVVGDTKIRIR
jgi:predicted nuclease of predicted toxin-antitoxin system